MRRGSGFEAVLAVVVVVVAVLMGARAEARMGVWNRRMDRERRASMLFIDDGVVLGGANAYMSWCW